MKSYPITAAENPKEEKKKGKKKKSPAETLYPKKDFEKPN